MPDDQKDEAFDDQPVRLDRDFNISAPRALRQSTRHVPHFDWLLTPTS